MRFSTYVLPAASFALAGVFSVIAAGFAVSQVEEASKTAITEQLQMAGLTWASVDATGLQVFLIGTAPTEAARFRALSNAGQVVDAARVIDQMDVEETQTLAPPRFSVEILRNDSGVSLIGLVPEGAEHEEVVARLHKIVGEDRVADLLETADHAVPDGWDGAMRFALDALVRLPRSKVSVEADHVQVTAMTESADEKRRVEQVLRRARPEGLRIALAISAPRPVITPFTLRYILEDGTGHFDACAADTETSRDRIVKAARANGLKGRADCTIGLGVPSTRWAEAAEMTLAALTRLGGGTVTLSDADISLIALEGTDQGRFDQTVGELENALPPVFQLTAVLPETPDESDDGPPEFTATRSPEGQVQMRGRVSTETARQTAESYAKAAFAGASVQMTARIDENLPGGWPVRVLAGLEALARLSNGAVTVTPDDLQVRGKTGNKQARADIARLLSEKLGEGAAYTIDVTYVEALDPESGLPTPEECLGRIRIVLGDRKLNFEPGSDTLDSAGKDIMDDIAEVLSGCGPINLEIAGHTDSQGRESMNLDLSQARAEAILTELRNRRVLTSTFRAKGYGEAQPIEDNRTEAGREANRRIEFRLVAAEATEESESALESTGNSEDEGGASATEDVGDEQD
ncbi:MAG: OmpA family protein [Rhodobacteraceae bacterium]|nr:MAG: OmpA family protein [Paracoccaceae bacterium]